MVRLAVASLIALLACILCLLGDCDIANTLQSGKDCSAYSKLARGLELR